MVEWLNGSKSGRIRMTSNRHETGQHIHSAAATGQRWRVMGDIVTARLTPAETNAAYSVFEVASPPGSGPAMLHTHAPQETFYILEGDYEFGGLGPDGPYVVRATTGAVVHIAAGVLHGFRNIGSTTGRMLIIYEPAGQMQSFFATMHAAVRNADPLSAPDTDLPSPQRILEIFAQHAMDVLPPDKLQAL
jgi:quercetin dioxygenase-like cupin family protein